MSRVFIIGGANIDICGASHEKLRAFDSNPGVITTSFGGVGRNIAENCCRLGQEVYFVTVFADDLYGKQLKAYCEEVGLNCSLSKVVHGARSSIYLAILNENNDMQLAMSDMDILKNMDTNMLMHALSQVKEDDLLVIDTNLEKKYIDFILANANAPVAIDPISTLKADKIKDELGRFTILKPNVYESKVFTGIEIVDKETAIATLDAYLEMGVKEPIISMGERGVIAANKDEKIWVSHKMVEVTNATGGGDAFLAAYLVARLKNKSLYEAVEFAIASAVCTVTCIETVNPDLCVKLVEEKIQELDIERESL
ncbi:MAG: carbohydrate kinase family protein [Anaerorhabdus sp.]|uniref:carbohydrate kinase family protein n=1 Tax=Anaerorhabdus sp. TaxID=1872524 RepID=UPI003A846E8A